MSQSQFSNVLFGMGNPLLDIAANVSTEFAVEKYGAEFGNAILANEKNIGVYEDLTTNFPVQYMAGGATMNVFRVFQWMLNKGPGNCNFLGCIGNDHFGEELTKQASKDGVNVRFMTTQEKPTGTCAVLVVEEEKERCLIANLSAANEFKHEHLLKDEQLTAMKQASFYYISGFFITVSPKSMLHVAEHALQENKVFMMNLSAMFICQFFLDPVKELLPYCDYLFANEDEARALSKALEWGTDDVLKIAEKAAVLEKKNTKRNRIVVFTQSSLPICIAIQDPESDTGVRSFQVPVEKLPKEKVVDTNGAGDSFCGGFISQLVQGKELDTCIKAGSYAARYIIQQSGCQFTGEPDFTA
uniref:Adenosine kinase n=1 Tax=Percolomonas cosmopolitus TaxID=63605 RepID=A0A7S1KTI3_9EUKA